MADSSERLMMDPGVAAKQLAAAGETRLTALAKGAPAFASDSYSADFVAVVDTAWAAATTRLAARIAAAAALSANSAAAVDGTEAANSAQLDT